LRLGHGGAMSCDELGIQKHLNLDDRRRRFDPGSKHGGHGGASVVTAMPRSSVAVDGYSDTYLKIKRPTDKDGNVLVSELDMEMQTLLQTDVEGCIAGDMPGGHWFRLPELLDEACISKKTRRDKACPDVIITAYRVAGVAWKPPNEEERRRLEQLREARLSLAQPDGRRLFCRLRDEPLERILEPTLLDRQTKLTASGSLHPHCKPEQARVLQQDELSCWCPGAADPGSFLEVDLGETCQVTWVSTQGRFPPIAKTDEETGMRAIRDGTPLFRNWVTSYELSYRTESGREWAVLGTFKGNSDMTTEVAHELERAEKASLQCRYLRFRPLTYEGLPAMRVGVYGVRQAGKSLPAPKDGDDVVEYSICRMKEATNLRRVPVTFSHCRYGCARCTKNRGVCKLQDVNARQRRMRIRSGVVEEFRRLDVSTGADALLKVEEEAAEAEAAELDGGSLAAPGADDAPLPPRPLALSRQRSLSDPQLSRAASSSVGDSYVHVEDPDSFAALGSDDWLVL